MNNADRVTIEQFRASARLSADIGRDTDDECMDGVAGMVYGDFDGAFLYIEKNAAGWMLTLERDSFCESLPELEARLYEFAVECGYIKAS